jgi:hypothetical protein
MNTLKVSLRDSAEPFVIVVTVARLLLTYG